MSESPEVATCFLACRFSSDISRSRAKLWKEREKTRLSDSLIVINIVIFLLDILCKKQLTMWGMKENSLILAGQWWRPFTSTFLHGSLLHLGVSWVSVVDILTTFSAPDLVAQLTESFSQPQEQLSSLCHAHSRFRVWRVFWWLNCKYAITHPHIGLWD